MAATVWKGYISFGLVSVPVRLYVAARDTHISFHQMHEVCGSRIKQQLFCPVCERIVQRNELVKGFEVDKTHSIKVEEQELRELLPASSEVMEIVQFVKNDDLDPIYFDASYYSVPETPGKRAYALLLKTMEEKQVSAVAKITLHQHERIVTIRPYDNGLAMHTMYYAEEVREVAEYGEDGKTEVNPKELALAGQFVDGLTQKFDPTEFKDTYEERVAQLIESKSEGKAAPLATMKPHLAPVIDLMEALQKSLAKKGAAKETKKAAASEKVREISAGAKKPVKRETAARPRRKTG
jgi:DNA end-binding protein Ku